MGIVVCEILGENIIIYIISAWCLSVFGLIIFAILNSKSNIKEYKKANKLLIEQGVDLHSRILYLNHRYTKDFFTTYDNENITLYRNYKVMSKGETI